MALKRRLDRYKRNLADAERMVDDYKADIRRTEGQLADLSKHKKDKPKSY